MLKVVGQLFANTLFMYYITIATSDSCNMSTRDLPDMYAQRPQT